MNALSKSPGVDEMPGKLYELALMMFILTRNQCRHFDLGKELKMGDKFDDIVIRRGNKYIFIQTKLVNDDPANCLSTKVLLGEERISLNQEDFKVRKYFVSYLRIKDQLEARGDGSDVEKVVTFTNAPLGKSDLRNDVLAIVNNDDVLPKTSKSAVSYKINATQPTNSLIQKLKLHTVKSDLSKLCEELAEYVTNPNKEPMVLDKDYFSYYHTALMDEKVVVVEERQHGNKLVKRGKFHDDFILDVNLSPRARKLRSGIMDLLEANVTQMKTAEWTISNDFDTQKTHDKIYLPSYSVTPQSISSFFKIFELRLKELNLKELSGSIRNEGIRRQFLKYHDADPAFVEFVIESFLKRWKNDVSSQREGWILDSERLAFVARLKNDIAKPTVKLKSEQYVTELEELISRFGLRFDDDSLGYHIDKRVVVVETWSTLLTSVKVLEYLKKNEIEDYVFLNLDGARRPEEIDEMISTFVSSEWSLFVLTCQSIDFSTIRDKTRSDQRVVIITASTPTPEFQCVKLTDRNFNVQDASTILEQSISFLGEPTALNELFDDEKLIDADTLVKLVTNQEVLVGSELLVGDGDYVVVGEDVDVDAFVDCLLRKSPDVYFINGMKGGNKTRRLVEVLMEQTNNNVKLSLSKLGNEVRLYHGGTKLIGKVLIADRLEEGGFKKVCRKNPHRKIYWINFNNLDCSLRLQQFYNPRFYIPRCFRKYSLITKEALHELTSDTTTTFIVNYNGELPGEEFASNVKFFRSPEEAKVAFSSMRSHGTIHWFSMEDPSRITWVDSSGSLRHLRRWIADVVMPEEEFIKGLEGRDVVIIADAPGTGKTTTVTELCESMRSWVIVINLKDRLESIQRLREVNVETVADFLCDAGDKFTKNLLTAALDKGTHFRKSLLVIFDGFDGLWDEDHREKTLELLRFLKEDTAAKLWVTTRSHYKTTLEDALCTFATQLVRFDDAQQQQFVTKYLEDRSSPILRPEDTSGYSEAFMRHVRSTFTDDTSGFTGTPLHLRLMLESSLPTDRQGRDIDELFQNFIDRKYEAYFRKLGVEERLKREQDKAIFDQYNRDLAKLLVLKAEPEVSLERFRPIVLSVGIIRSQGERVGFLHPTFKEFFAAELFVHWMKKQPSRLTNLQKQEYLLREVLVDADYKLIRSFVDLKLGKVGGLPGENLKEYARILSTFTFTSYALLTAAGEGNSNIAEFMLEVAGDLSPEGVYDILKLREELVERTVLHRWCYDSNTRLIGAVLKLATNKFSPKTLCDFLKLQDHNGKTALHYVCNLTETALETIEMLLKTAAKYLPSEKLQNFLTVRDESLGTALHLACRNTRTDLTKALLDVSLDCLTAEEFYDLVATPDVHGKTAFHHACLTSVEMADSMLDAISGKMPLTQIYEVFKLEDRQGKAALQLVSDVQAIGIINCNRGVFLDMARREGCWKFIRLFENTG